MSKSNNDKVKVLGVEINEENFPVLVRRVRNDLERFGNLEHLESQVRNVADAWHEGNVVSALQALESDLEHSSVGG